MRNATFCLILLAVMLFAAPSATFSQSEDLLNTLKIVKTPEAISVDGVDNERTWLTAPVARNFINKWPLDTGLAKQQTEVRMLYDDKFLYVFAKMYVSRKALVLQSLKRDVNPYYSEGFSVVIDATGQKSAGITFGVNAGGAQFDGIVQLNSDSFEMDAKWFSATKKYNGYWTAEMAIPFKSLRFQTNKKTWGINFIRNDMDNNCFSTWQRVPLAYFGANLGFLGRAVFDDAPSRSANNNTFVPYVNTDIDSMGHGHIHTGLDARMSLSSSLNLNVTVNPDFSQVDVDQQVINLDRYDILLPEKRSFFLENNDLYSTLGSTNVRPFVSRSIGLTDSGTTIPLVGGLRLNGYLDAKSRIEVMDMQSGRQPGSFSENYYVAVYERRLLQRSTLRAYVTGVDAFNDPEGVKTALYKNYNNTAGTEFNYVAPKGNYDMGVKLSKSFNPGGLNDNLYTNAYADYYSSHIIASTQFNDVGKNYIAALGFTPRLYNFDALHDTTVRLGYYENSSHIEYDMYPRNKSLINLAVLETNPSVFLNKDGSLSESDFDIKYTLLFANRRTVYIGWQERTVNLPYETSIIDGLNNFNPGRYTFGYLKLDLESNFLKPFSWSVYTEAGQYFNGSRVSVTGGIKQRFQPWVNLALNFNYNYITAAGKTATPFLISPTVEVAFNNTMFFTTYAQYNTDINNFNINSRFQWRYRPMSDIFLVYASNYAIPGISNTSYSLTFKIVYWIN